MERSSESRLEYSREEEGGGDRDCGYGCGWGCVAVKPVMDALVRVVVDEDNDNVVPPCKNPGIVHEEQIELRPIP